MTNGIPPEPPDATEDPEEVDLELPGHPPDGPGAADAAPGRPRTSDADALPEPPDSWQGPEEVPVEDAPDPLRRPAAAGSRVVRLVAGPERPGPPDPPARPEFPGRGGKDAPPPPDSGWAVVLDQFARFAEAAEERNRELAEEIRAALRAPRPIPEGLAALLDEIVRTSANAEERDGKLLERLDAVRTDLAATLAAELRAAANRPLQLPERAAAALDDVAQFAEIAAARHDDLVKRMNEAHARIEKTVDGKLVERLAAAPVALAETLAAELRAAAERSAPPPEGLASALDELARLPTKIDERDRNLAERLDALRANLAETLATELREAAKRPLPLPESAAAALDDIVRFADASTDRHDDLLKKVNDAHARIEKTVDGKLDDAALRNAGPEIAERLRVLVADLTREREATRRGARWLVRAVSAAALVATLALGAAVQHRFAPIPVSDPTAGWRDWLWTTHGRGIRECAREAIRTGKSVDCGVVARPVERDDGG